MLRRPFLRRLAYVRRNRCSLLLAALVVLILVNPVLAGSPVGATILSFALLAILMLAVWALRVRRFLFWIVIALGLVVAQAMAVDRMGGHWLRPFVLVGAAAFLFVVTIALLRYVLDWHPITPDKIFGAVAAYVLIAFTFASLFGLLQLIQPNAFYVQMVNEPDGHLG